jgi:poly(A) polymerase
MRARLPELATPAAALVSGLADVFHQHGHQLYLVGGSVRAALLGQAYHDTDLTTDATPDRIKQHVRELRPDHIYTVGEKFGTIGVVFGDHVFEITTFRSEWYSGGSRKPQVRFGGSLEEDLSRRDFTINAIAQDARTGELFDPFEGVRDLEARLVRAVGDPQQRFREDPLRLLRAVRFAVQLGFTIAPATRQAIAQSAATLASISRERVGAELKKVLLAERPSTGIRLLTDLGLMQHIMPELLLLRGKAPDGWHHKDIYEHTLGVLDNTPPDPVIRWAALLHDIAKPQTLTLAPDGEVRFLGHEFLGEKMSRDILRRLKQDAATTERVAHLVREHLRANSYASDWTDGAVRRLMRDAGDDLGALFALSRADITSHNPPRVKAAYARLDELRSRCEQLEAQASVARLSSPLDGHDLMQLFGRGPGPWIGRVKDYLLGLVLDGELAPDDQVRARELAMAFVAGENAAPGAGALGR